MLSRIASLILRGIMYLKGFLIKTGNVLLDILH
jgi:hypothetical protein